MRATEVTAGLGLVESNGSLVPGLWHDSLHVTCGLTACTPGSAPGPTLGNEYGKTLPFTSAHVSQKQHFQTSPHLPRMLPVAFRCVIYFRSYGRRRICRNGGVSIPLQRVTSSRRRAQNNAPVASNVCVVSWTSPTCKGCRGRSLQYTTALLDFTVKFLVIVVVVHVAASLVNKEEYIHRVTVT